MTMGNAEGVWKWIASGLLGILISGAGFWMLFGQDIVTRPEVEEMIKAAPYPYNLEKQMVRQSLETHAREIHEIKEIMMEIQLNQVRLMTKLGVTPME